MYMPTTARKPRRAINITQGSPQSGGFKKGYISTLADSRTPIDGLSDMTNAELDQDNLPRPRPSTVAYGPTMLGTCLGIGTFVKIVSGAPERWQITMQVISGVGQIVINKDGGAWTTIGGSYSATAIADLTQSNNRVYISNKVDAMSYYNINTGALITASALSNPATPTATQTGLTGTNHTLRYRVTANNSFGETAASVAGTVSVSKLRDTWAPTGEYVDLSVTAVAGASSYNWYVGTVAGSEYRIATGVGNTFRDDGHAAANPFSPAPAGNSTGGQILERLINKDGQLFGVGDPVNPSYLWYSGVGESAGDFSPLSGGGYVGIDYGGPNLPTAVFPFRTGKGDPAITVLSKGSAGKGKLHHAVGTSATYGDTLITYFDVKEANGQSGTVSPRGVIEANNSLFYPTGTDFKSTGTKANIVNILNTDSISQVIERDVQNLNLMSMDKCVGLEYQNKLYWAVPNGTTENNEIWIYDLSRNGAWILRWTLAAKFMWLYEDNAGVTHHCIYNGTKIVEFTRSVFTQDDGIPFRTRVAHDGIVFDDAGISLASIEKQRFKLLQPTGSIQINAYGIGEDGPIDGVLGDETYEPEVSFTGWNQIMYSYEGDSYEWGQDVGTTEFLTQSSAVVPLEIDEIVNQLDWEIITEGANTDYTLSTVNTNGLAIPGAYIGD